MAAPQKHMPKSKQPTPPGSPAPSDRDFTCSEVQVDNLLSEGESTGLSDSTSKDASKTAVVRRRKGQLERS